MSEKKTAIGLLCTGSFALFYIIINKFHDKKYQQNIKILTVFLIISYIYSIYIAPYYETTHANSFINKIHKSCVVPCKDDICKNLMKQRGKKYFIGVTDEEDVKNMSNCFITFWGFTHLIFYVIVGIFLPNLVIETIIIGVLFEVFEYIKFDCHDPLDVILNITGFFIGKYISKI